MNIVGIDVGGAHIKYASHLGQAHATYFPLWTDHRRLAEAISDGIAQFPDPSAIALTMTGELADCFIDRSDGVAWIVDQTVQAARKRGISDVAVYDVDGCFVGPESAKNRVDRVAASNWHASAHWISQSRDQEWTTQETGTSGPALVIDVGSTTTDLIPIGIQGVATNAKTDFDRLVEGSLVYVGCQRTSLATLVDHLDFQGQSVRVMNEQFATMDDVFVTLRWRTEDPDDLQTADGKPRTREHAANRIARMIGLDRRHVTITQAESLALQFVKAAKSMIGSAVSQVDPGGPAILIGHGERLLDLADDRPRIQADQKYGTEVSRAFPAFAVAQLFRHNRVEVKT